MSSELRIALHALHAYRRLKKTIQQDCSERRVEAYPLGYVEGLNDARTKLGGFFSLVIKKNGPLLCGTPKLPSEPGDVQQSFSRPR